VLALEAGFDPGAAPVQDETLRTMEAARNYNAWLLGRGARYIGTRVVDVGAGIGTFTEALAPGRELVVALEPDPRFAEHLRQRFAGWPNVEVREQDASALEALPFKVDTVLCFNVLEHIRDDAGTLASLWEALRPGGTLLLLVPAHPKLYGSLDRYLGHERRYRKLDVASLLQRVGFHLEEVRLVNPAGVLGWFVSARVLNRRVIPHRSLALYDRLVPVLRRLDALELPVGLSVWAVGRRPDGDKSAADRR
jgi:SAM-dependent methyltransferase